MLRATLCTNLERAKKFAVLDTDSLSHLLTFSHAQVDVSSAMQLRLSVLQSCKILFNVSERLRDEEPDEDMQHSWVHFALTVMRHLLCHGVVVTCLMEDAQGRPTPTVMNVEQIRIAQFVGEALTPEYAVFRRGSYEATALKEVDGSAAVKGNVYVRAMLNHGTGGGGVSDMPILTQGSDLYTDVFVFESQMEPPCAGQIRTCVGVLYHEWINVCMARSCALRAAQRMSNPAIVMEPRDMSSASAELATGLRNNAATEAALTSMDNPSLDLGQLATQDSRLNLWQTQVAEQNRRRQQFAGLPMKASAGEVIGALQQQDRDHNGLPEAPRVQLPYGMALKNTTSATEPRVYTEMVLEFRKSVCVLLKVPASMYESRSSSTVAGDVTVLELFERQNVASIKAMQWLFNFFWTHLQQANINLLDRTEAARGQGKKKANEEEEEEKNRGPKQGYKRKKTSLGKASVLMRFNPQPERLLQLWESGMIKWGYLREELSQLTCLPLEAFVEQLKPDAQRGFDLKEQNQTNQVRQRQQELKQRSLEQAKAHKEASVKTQAASAATTTAPTTTTTASAGANGKSKRRRIGS